MRGLARGTISTGILSISAPGTYHIASRLLRATTLLLQRFLWPIFRYFLSFAVFFFDSLSLREGKRR